MKNNKFLYILIIVALGSIGYYLSTSETSVSRSDRRDFAIADTSQVMKVILSSKLPEVAVLERVNENHWTLNETYKARRSAIFYLLKTLQRMEIAHPVPLSMRENVIGNLAIKGIKVQVFLTNGQEKTFYVGGENQELSATFMMLQNATDPYAVHIPGFRGYLSGRFFTQESLWRDKTVMNYDNLNIESIQMHYGDINLTKESFHINLIDGAYQLSDFEAQNALNVNQTKMQSYIASFRKLHAEGFITHGLNIDSLLNETPIFELTVNTKDNQETRVTAYHKKAKEGTYVDGEITMRDPERMYALINDEDWVIIQTNTFGKVMKKLSDFQSFK